jgi:prephenate dehydratase
LINLRESHVTNIPIVLLGPAGATFTYRAYHQIAPHFGAPALNGNIIEAKRNSEILEILTRTPDAFGLIAVETKVGGRINDSLEAFLRLGDPRHSGEYAPVIAGAARVQLSFALMSKGIDISAIEGIIAHPQAIQACSTEILKYGWAESTHPSTSNGLAAEAVASDPRYAKYAVLGPVEAAEKFQLRVVNAEFQRGLTTFFLLTSGRAQIATGSSNRALAIFRARSGPGALRAALEPFERHGINMIHLHSMHAENGIYDFVAEIEGKGTEVEHMRLSLEGLRQVTERTSTFGPFQVIDL